jgi:hypothetical protein
MKQFEYKKVINFTKQQKETFEILKKYNVNINQFIRLAIKEKIQRDWKSIKEKKNREYNPFN